MTDILSDRVALIVIFCFQTLLLRVFSELVQRHIAMFDKIFDIGARRFTHVSSLALISNLLFFVCLPGSATAQEVQGAKPELQNIIVGTTGRFPPYSMLDLARKPYGFSIDIMDAVAKRANLSVEYHITPRGQSIIKELKAGIFDVIPSFGIADRRRKDFAFTSPIETARISIFIRSDTIDLKDLSDLPGRNVGVVKPNLTQRLLEKREGVKTTNFVDVPTAFFALLSGRIDAFGYTEAVAIKFARDAGIEDRLKIVDEALFEVKRGMMVRKDRTALLERLEAGVKGFVDSAEYREIYVKWFGRPKPFWTTPKVVMSMAAAILTLLTIFLIWHYLAVVRLNRRLAKSLAETKEAGSALNESERRLKTTFEYAGIGIVNVDLMGNFLAVNDSFADFVGRERNALTGTPYKNITHPGDYEHHLAAIKAMLAGTMDVYADEMRCIRPDDDIAWANVTTVMVKNEDGSPDYFTTFVLNVTERKKIEAHYRDLIEMSPDAIYIHRDNKIIFANQKAVEMYGAENREALIGISPYDFLRPDEREIAYERSRNMLSDGNFMPLKEFQHTTLDNRLIDIEATGRSVMFDGQEALLTYARDIGPRKEMQNRLAQAQRLEAVGQLTGGIAHDFNNLLAVFVGNAEILQSMIGDDELVNKSVDAIIRAGDRGSSLTSRLLGFSRQQTLSPASTNISDQIAGLEDLFRRTLGETIDLRVSRSDTLWPAMTDPHQFENALINLAINARDAMPGGGMLVIETANTTLDETFVNQQEDVAAGDYILIAVSDTGSGMPPELVEKVFEPFFTTKDVGKGSGLGLSMVYGFTKQSNGHISIYSEPDQGTTIKMYLPRSRESAAMSGIEGQYSGHRIGSERILVVEDDAGVREVPVNILTDQGYQIVEASNGEEAINHLENGPAFDLLFTDIVLPGGMNGVDIATRAKQIQPGIKILFTTGYAESAIVERGHLDPSEVLVNKPYRRAELLEKVRSIIEKQATP